ncbi:hypothetical protein, partial [Enterobacter asburiae]
DRNRSHWSTSKTPSYTKSVSWQHHRPPKEHPPARHYFFRNRKTNHVNSHQVYINFHQQEPASSFTLNM